MLKASALYMAIIIALVIAIFSASLITTAYFYRSEVQKKLRYTKLLNNLNSGISIVLSEDFKPGETLIDLYAEENDSLLLEKEAWGLFELATVRSFTQNDTLKRAFLIAEDVPADTVAIYLSDEDRPLSVSGSTKITGDALLPKAGVKQSYVEGLPYEGSKLVYGNIRNSKRELPPLDSELLRKIELLFADSTSTIRTLGDTVSNSFFNPTLVLHLSEANSVISTVIQGKIILFSDTTITLTAEASLKDILVFAPAIVVKEGFKGSCQLFARDSIVTGKNTVFAYPSSMAVLKPDSSKLQAKIYLGSGSVFSGILFSYEKERSDMQTVVSIGKGSHVKGEVFVTGFIRMEKPARVDGKVSCNRFIIQTPTTLYENYLIDISLNRRSRSKYYLSSSLFEAKSEKKILRWLN